MTALLALAVIVAVLGPTLTIVPLATLRVVVGFLLLAFGLQWLRKAILRASGVLALHDEERIFSDEIGIAHAHAAPTSDHFDWYTFTLAFKGVFLEGLEVAFIVVVFGSAHHDLSLAVGAAAAAVVVVGAAGVLVHRPLSRVPENTMKFGVGLMLCSFGTFWGTEGADVHWPGGDAAIVGLRRVLYRVLARPGRDLPSPGSRGRGRRAVGPRMRRVRTFGRFWYDFVVGDDWRLAGSAVVALAVPTVVPQGPVPAWVIAPVVIVAALTVSVFRHHPA